MDEASEIERGAEQAARSLDLDHDSRVSASEIELFWNQLGTLLTNDEVLRWIEHAVQLPQYLPTFREHAVTGYDFPALVEPGSNILVYLRELAPH